MNHILQKQLRKYYRNIRKHLSGNSKKKRVFIHALKVNIENYIMEHSVTDITEIHEQFGTVEELAEAYLEEQPNLALMQNVRKLNAFRISATIMIFAMLIYFIAFVHELREGYPTEIEIIIQEEPNATD